MVSRVRIVMILAVTSLVGGVLSAAEWVIETVDPSGPGYYTSMKADRAGNIHLAYVSEIPSHPLQYAYWDQSVKRWFTMNVAGNASFSALALDSMDRPHISFVDFGTGLGCKVRHAFWDRSWHVVPIDVRPGAIMAYYTSIALNKDEPILTFYDYADATSNMTLQLRSLFWSGSHWESATVDRTRGSGKFNSVAVDSTGRPQIAYANVSAETASFRYGTWDGTRWKVEVIDGKTGSSSAYSLSMTLDKNDNPHVVYTDLAHKWIKYATRRNNKWTIEPVDSYSAAADGQGYWDRDGIIVDSDGVPYVSYFDRGLGALKVAHRVGGRWFVEVVDNNMSGMTSSLTIANGELWVAYAALLEQALKVAHRRLDGAHEALSERPEAASHSKRQDDPYEHQRR